MEGPHKTRNSNTSAMYPPPLSGIRPHVPPRSRDAGSLSTSSKANCDSLASQNCPQPFRKSSYRRPMRRFSFLSSTSLWVWYARRVSIGQGQPSSRLRKKPLIMDVILDLEFGYNEDNLMELLGSLYRHDDHVSRSPQHRHYTFMDKHNSNAYWVDQTAISDGSK